MMRRYVRTAMLVAALATPLGGRAQGPGGLVTPPQVFTLEQAIQYAADHYPTVRAALEQVNVSIAGVSVARAAYLPRLDSLWQSNRATANNIFGQVLPQSGHSRDVRSRSPVGVRAERVGQRDGRAVLVGAVRFRPAEGARSPAPRQRSRGRARASR